MYNYLIDLLSLGRVIEPPGLAGVLNDIVNQSTDHSSTAWKER